MTREQTSRRERADRPLFIFEMANNHQGSVEHGLRIIDAMREAAEPFFDRFRFALKFQYRDLDTFIHPDARGRADIRNVKRFEETRLSRKDFDTLFARVKNSGMLAVCTPFDEVSAARIAEEGFDYIKIASCSFADWPLMEAVAATRLPAIASAAGSPLETVRAVVAFFRNRRIPLALMHCVGEYPTPPEHLQMNQLDLYRREFPQLVIGFSTHEAPDNLEPVKIAVAKGARIFEKHVGVPTESIRLNGYSAAPSQVAAWLAAADTAFAMCGVEGRRCDPTPKEAADLAALRRGVFASADLAAQAPLDESGVFLAFPCREGQLVAQDLTKYAHFTLRHPLAAGKPVMREDVEEENIRPLVVDNIRAVAALLCASGAVVPAGSECELSHHYGLAKFRETGLTLISCVNREYCKKLLVLLPGQRHPAHHHVEKEETFIVLHGALVVDLDGKSRTLARGDTLTVPRGLDHSFRSDEGCVFEEISSTHKADDSYYADADDFVRPRKTRVYLTRDILSRDGE